MTKTKMFGSYLHALVNTKNEERIFSQARRTAVATSDIQKIFQLTSVQNRESSVAKASKQILAKIYEKSAKKLAGAASTY